MPGRGPPLAMMTSRTSSSTSLAMPTSNLSLNVFEVRTGKRICSATVYLYHPPFALDVAVDYASLAPGANVSELFNPPRGWGVLRSSAGLLLWLRLDNANQLLDVS